MSYTLHNRGTARISTGTSFTAHTVFGDGNYIYVGANGSYLHAFTNPNGGNVSYLGLYNTSPVNRVRGVFADASRIYTASDGAGLRIYTFNGTSFSQVASENSNATTSYAVHKSGNYVFIADSANGLHAYTYDGTTLTYKDSDDQGTSNYWGVWSDGTYIYTGCRADGLRAHSFDGTTITHITSLDNGDDYYKVWGDGNTYIYVACGASGLRAYYFNGSTFTLAGSIDEGSGVCQDVYYANGKIYAACGSDGIKVYTFNGSTFTNVATFNDGNTYTGVWADANYIYGAGGTSGLRILVLAEDTALSGYGERFRLYHDNTTYNHISANLTDFPVLLTEANLPARIFDRAKSDGGDIRFTSDAAGVNQLPFEIVRFDTVNDKAEIWVLVSSLTTGSTTSEFYVWFDNPNASALAADNLYGRNAVWRDFRAVYHMGQDPSGTAPQITDSTGRWNGTSVGSMTSGDLVDGKAGKAIDFDGSNDGINCGDINVINKSAITLEAWANFNTDQTGERSLIRKENEFDLEMYPNDNQLRFSLVNASTRVTVTDTDTTVSASTWYYLAGTWDNADDVSALYLNGAATGDTGTMTADIRDTSGTNFNFGIGYAPYYATSVNANALIDEVRYATERKSAAYLLATYNTITNPSTFIQVGAESSASNSSTSISSSSDSVSVSSSSESSDSSSSISISGSKSSSSDSVSISSSSDSVSVSSTSSNSSSSNSISSTSSDSSSSNSISSTSSISNSSDSSSSNSVSKSSVSSLSESSTSLSSASSDSSYDFSPLEKLYNKGTYSKANVYLVCRNSNYVFSSGGTNIYACSYNGSSFTELGSINVGGISDIACDENYVYVVGSSGIKAYSFNGSTFSLAGSIGTFSSNNVQVDDGYIIVTPNNNAALSIYTFNGTSFSLVDSVSDSFYVNFYKSGNYIYAAVGANGIYVYSFNGTSLSKIDELDEGIYISRIYSDGHYVYAQKGDEPYQLRVYHFDGSNLSNEGFITNTDAIEFRGDGQYLYVAGDALKVYYWNGERITLIGTIDETALYQDIFYYDNRIYTGNGAGLIAYDWATSSLSLSSTSNSSSSDSISISSSSDSISKSSSSFSGSRSSSSDSSISSLSSDSSHSSSSHSSSSYSSVILDTLELLNSSDLGATNSLLDISYDGTYVYTINSAGTLRAFSSTLSYLNEVGGIGACHLWCNNGYIYVACGTNGLKVYTFNGSSFSLFASHYIANSGYYRDVQGDGTYIYVWSDNNLIAYTLVGSSLIPTYQGWNVAAPADGNIGNAIVCKNNKIYFACHTNGFRVYSFNGTSFDLLNSTTNIGNVNAIDSDSYGSIYVATTNAIYSYSSSYQYRGSTTLSGIYSLFINSNDYVFAASLNDGLVIYKNNINDYNSTLTPITTLSSISVREIFTYNSLFFLVGYDQTGQLIRKYNYNTAFTSDSSTSSNSSSSDSISSSSDSISSSSDSISSSSDSSTSSISSSSDSSSSISSSSISSSSISSSSISSSSISSSSISSSSNSSSSNSSSSSVQIEILNYINDYQTVESPKYKTVKVGNYVFALIGTTLRALDTDLNYITQATVTNAHDIFVRGDYIYITRKTTGLSVYSFNGTSFSHVVTHYNSASGAYYGVGGDNHYVFISAANSIIAYLFNNGQLLPVKILNWSVGAPADADLANGIYCRDNKVYFACHTNGFRVYLFDGNNFNLLNTTTGIGNVNSICSDSYGNIFVAVDNTIKSYTNQYIFRDDTTYTGVYSLTISSTDYIIAGTTNGGFRIYETNINDYGDVLKLRNEDTTYKIAGGAWDGDYLYVCGENLAGTSSIIVKYFYKNVLESESSKSSISSSSISSASSNSSDSESSSSGSSSSSRVVNDRFRYLARAANVGDLDGITGDGTYIYTGSNPSHVRAFSFDGQTISLINSYRNGYARNVTGLVAADSRLHASATSHGVLCMAFNGSRFRGTNIHNATGNNYIALVAGGDYIYCADTQGNIIVYELVQESTYDEYQHKHTFKPVNATNITALNYFDGVLYIGYKIGNVAWLVASIYDGTDNGVVSFSSEQYTGWTISGISKSGNYVYIVNSETTAGVTRLSAMNYNIYSRTLVDVKEVTCDGYREQGVFEDVYCWDNRIFVAASLGGLKCYSFNGTDFTLENTYHDNFTADEAYYAPTLEIYCDNTYLYTICNVVAPYDNHAGVRVYRYAVSSESFSSVSSDSSDSVSKSSHSSFSDSSISSQSFISYSKSSWSSPSVSKVSSHSVSKSSFSESSHSDSSSSSVSFLSLSSESSSSSDWSESSVSSLSSTSISSTSSDSSTSSESWSVSASSLSSSSASAESLVM